MGIKTMITKSGKRYRVEVMVNGKRNSETFKRRSDAEAYLKGMESMRASHPGSNQYQEKLKLGKAWMDFVHMKELAGVDKRSTISTYKNSALFLKHLFDKDILEITDDEFVDVFKNAKNFKNGNLLSRAHLRSIKNHLNQVIKLAMEKGFVRKDFSLVLARIDKEIKKGKLAREGIAYTQEEVHKIMNTHPDGAYWIKPLFLILLITGKRIGEILGLTWDKISFADRTIRIDQMISKGEYHNHLKLEAPPHTIEMDENLVNIFLDLKAIQIMRNFPDADWVFPSDYPESRAASLIGEHPCPYSGKPIGRETVGMLFTKFMIKAGVRKIPIHDLRRTSATLTYIRHASNKLVNQIVQKKLNHKSFDVTQKYVKVPDQTLKESMMDSSISDIICENEEKKQEIVKSESFESNPSNDKEAMAMKIRILELELKLEEMKRKKIA